MNRIHLKYIDDLTVAETVNLRQLDTLPIHERPQPDNYHARTGHHLDPAKSEVVEQLGLISQYTELNKMKLNLSKTELMLFNNSKKYDFIPNIKLQGIQLETVEEIKLLGVVLRSDMRWTSNTKSITLKGYKRLWILSRLKYLGATDAELLDVYTKQVRPLLEYAAPVWHPNLTNTDSEDIERVQKSALKLILQKRYRSYETALNNMKLTSLSTRREKLCTKFALKAETDPKFSKWFQEANKTSVTRGKPMKYSKVH